MHKWSYSLQNKEQLRQSLLAKRANITAKQRDKAAKSAMTLLQNAPVFLQSQHVACYFPQDREFNCIPMIEMIWQLKKMCYLPVLSSTQNKCLEFVAYQMNTSLRFNRYKILEPEHEERFAADKLDLVIVPLVGFDNQGQRLGMGGGYYDRTFCFLQQSALKKPFLLGLAYEMQHVSSLPHDPWDVLLNGVLTEKLLVEW